MATRIVKKPVGKTNKITTMIGKFASASRFGIVFNNLSDKFSATEKVTQFVKSVELPQVERKTTDYVFDGLKFPIAREITYKNTTDIVFYMDESGTRQLFIDWLSNGANGDNKTYSEAIISHYTSAGSIKDSLNDSQNTDEYKLENIFPISVGSVQLSSESNSILEYTVSFMYATWRYNDNNKTPFPPTPSDLGGIK